MALFGWLSKHVPPRGALLTTLAVFLGAAPLPYDVHLNPLLELNVPAFWKGELSPNLGMLLGLSAHASAVLYYAVLVVGGTWLWRSLKATVDGPGAGRVGI